MILKKKRIFDDALLNRKYDVLTSLVWTFDGFSNFAASGGEAPARDYENNLIQDLMNPSVPARHIFLSVFPENDKTYAIIAWLKQYDSLFSSIKERLMKTSNNEKRNYINNTIPIIAENICIKPSAWNALPKIEQDEFGMLFFGLADIMETTGQKFDRFQKPSFDLFDM